MHKASKYKYLAWCSCKTSFISTLVYLYFLIISYFHWKDHWNVTRDVPVDKGDPATFWLPYIGATSYKLASITPSDTFYHTVQISLLHAQVHVKTLGKFRRFLIFLSSLAMRWQWGVLPWNQSDIYLTNKLSWLNSYLILSDIYYEEQHCIMTLGLLISYNLGWGGLVHIPPTLTSIHSGSDSGCECGCT